MSKKSKSVTTMAITTDDAISKMEKMDSVSFAERFRGYISVVPELVKLDPGDWIEGTFQGFSEYEATDPKTGEVKKLIATHLKVGPESHQVIRLTDSFKMRQSFGTEEKPGEVPIGAKCVVHREDDVETKKGTRMSDLRVLFDPKSVGVAPK